ncbi:prohead core protein [uncultured Caudovirales phage]|uniref:Prohead core protein n=1 Tax=uncultured Caudovirales phage TaxID=2100421 RepID=A0A6J7WUR1_9CAUD|nr:prohead core protein [uncultured Caudovirales phage]
MSIEQKIAELLAESKKAKLHEQLEEVKLAGAEGGSDSAKGSAQGGDKSVIRTGNPVPNGGETPNPENAKNNVDNEDEAANATSKKPNVATAHAAAGDQSVIRKGNAVKEDMAALFNGEDLSEEFKDKATTIYEAAVMSRVKEEVARIEEEFEAKLEEAVAQNTEGLVEQVDGYLGYIAEQWIAQNEIALERGMKSEILEGFIGGLKGLFEEHYIDIPEERLDVLGEMESKIEELEAKLNEQLAANVEMNKTIAEQKRSDIVKTVSEGLTDTEVEKFTGLVEELAYEDAESFETKVKTIRENYFTTKVTSGVKSVVTDAPVENLTEEVSKKVDPTMSAYLSALNKNK